MAAFGSLPIPAIFVEYDKFFGLGDGFVISHFCSHFWKTISVIGAGRAAEGTAVGFNKKKKGQRSYYPLFCTVAQTGQVFNVLHRSGNVHDSNGAEAFILLCIKQVQAALPGIIIEVRIVRRSQSVQRCGNLSNSRLCGAE